MYLFIAIVFIAELIIAGAFIALLINADRKVRALNAKVTAFKPELESVLKRLKGIVMNFVSGVQNSYRLVQRKRRKYIRKVISAMIMYAFLFFFKNRYKRAAVVFQTLALLKEYRDEKYGL